MQNHPGRPSLEGAPRKRNLGGVSDATKARFEAEATRRNTSVMGLLYEVSLEFPGWFSPTDRLPPQDALVVGHWRREGVDICEAVYLDGKTWRYPWGADSEAPDLWHPLAPVPV